ncbi:MAG TPA: arginine--tRNA ligase [Candidatus Thermoplasmatota archaeon]|nr:arginine--tRNA ligase [Candidatus Thermoplasmatota archaeon]
MHDPLDDLRREAQARLEEAVHALGLEGVDVRLAKAPEGKGDFALPCFAPAARLRRKPHELASEIAAALPPSPNFDARAEGPYVNVVLRDAPLLASVLAAVRKHGAGFGRHPATGRRVLVEHTSANPNGPFHVGRARNPIIGDALARVLSAAGEDVATEYYVNDLGKQVCILAWGLANLQGERQEALVARHGDLARPRAPERQKADHRLVGYYQAASALLEADAEVKAEIDALAARVERDPSAAAEIVQPVVRECLEGMRESLSRIGVTMGRFTWESEFAGEPVEGVLASLAKVPEAGTEDGALFLDLASHGIHGKETRFFLTRKDGSSLYTTRDVAYHLSKLERVGQNGRAVNVLGEDHKLEAKQVAIALSLLLAPRARPLAQNPNGVALLRADDDVREIVPVFYSFVSLPEGKMSTRRARVVTLDDLVDEAHELALEEVRKRRGDELSEEAMGRIAEIVGTGALRFNIAGVQAEKQIVFRWEEALDFEGASAPFVQYAHARAASILRKAADEGAQPSWSAEPLAHPSEAKLARVLARLPGVVRECALELKVHPIAPFAVAVAGTFNEFYRDCPVLAAEPALRDARLSLVAATKQVLANTLALYGVVAPESM